MGLVSVRYCTEYDQSSSFGDGIEGRTKEFRKSFSSKGCQEVLSASCESIMGLACTALVDVSAGLASLMDCEDVRGLCTIERIGSCCLEECLI